MRATILTLALFTVVAAGFVSAARPASSAFPGGNGRIVFVHRDEEPSPPPPTAQAARLLTIRRDGSGLRPLTAPPEGRVGLGDIGPVWSPDGKQVAFMRVTEPSSTAWAESRELFVVNADGTGLRQLTRNSIDDCCTATWSPDGSQIAFVRWAPNASIWIVRSDGTRERRLSTSVRQAPAWSPDGRWIAHLAPNGWIERVHPDGSGRRRVVRSEYYSSKFGAGEAVEWAPSSTRLAVVADVERLVSMTPTGKRRRTIGRGFDPAWSPDGRWLVVTVYSIPERFATRLWVVRADGSGRTPLIRATSSPSDYNPDWQPLCSRNGTAGVDVVRGTRRDERLCGLGGNDLIIGGAGVDRLFGEDGNDRFRARDGIRDIVGCGAGSDAVLADRVDLVGVDCERVRRVAGGVTGQRRAG